MIKLDSIIFLIAFVSFTAVSSLGRPAQPESPGLEAEEEAQNRQLIQQALDIPRPTTDDQVHGTPVGQAQVSNEHVSSSNTEGVASGNNYARNGGELERALDDLRHLADGTPVETEPTTTTTASPEPSRRPWVFREWTTTAAPEVQSVQTPVAHASVWPPPRAPFARDFFRDEADLDVISDRLREEFEREQEARREKLRVENLERIEEFLRSKMDPAASSSHSESSEQDENSPDEARDEVECPICKKSHTTVKLDCGHAYHFDCLKGWFLTITPAKTCPLCRRAH